MKWNCVHCSLPQNPNWARRIQDIKEFGYTLSTNTKYMCSRCRKNTTHIMLIPIKRGGVTGYETWSSKLRQKIIETLKYYDAFEAKSMKPESLLPDHKFPEIRWDINTRRDNMDDMSMNEIINDFQLLSNQRNLQKREICRNCYQTGKRGEIYGFKYYYQGEKEWDESLPKSGKLAEKGCIGCPWYDIEKWRIYLKNILNKSSPT
ncbi:MAG: hypothetical protein LBH05_05390 [Deferribacteraceae bacterium]|jgi:hypothetical protein|nr:hypothetical protein [Deferribacteraceae bacterium]